LFNSFSAYLFSGNKYPIKSIHKQNIYPRINTSTRIDDYIIITSGWVGEAGDELCSFCFMY